MKKKWWIVIGAVALIGIIVYVVLSSQAKAAQMMSNYQTEKLTKGTFTASVGATGTVHSNQSAILPWQTSGTVSKVNVEVDQVIKAGDTLAELKNDSMPANVINAYVELVNAQRDLDDLLKSNLPAAQAFQAVADAQKALEDAQDKVASYEYKRGTAEDERYWKSQVVLAQEQVDWAERLYKRTLNLSPANPKRAQAETNLYNARQNLQNKQATLNWFTSKPSDIDYDVDMAAFEVAKQKLEDANREWERLKDGPDKDDIAAAEARVTAAQATINMAKIEAPFNGTVTEVYSKPGDTVTAGTQAFRIDDLSRLLIDVEISEVDINQVEIGQPVSISFDAISGKTYNGIVKEVARVGTITSGVVNFMVTVELSDADGKVLPQMTAGVTITTIELDNVILIPNRAVRMVDGNRVVFVLRDNVPTSIQVGLGSSNGTYSELRSGDLNIGDAIILNPGPELTSGPGGMFMMGGR